MTLRCTLHPALARAAIGNLGSLSAAISWAPLSAVGSKNFLSPALGATECVLSQRRGSSVIRAVCSGQLSVPPSAIYRSLIVTSNRPTIAYCVLRTEYIVHSVDSSTRPASPRAAHCTSIMATMANHDRAATQPTCQNCTTHTTPLWRRDETGAVLCNACGLFLKLHGRPRPISLKTDVIKSRNRVKTMRPDLAKQKKVSHCPSRSASNPCNPSPEADLDTPGADTTTTPPQPLSAGRHQRSRPLCRKRSRRPPQALAKIPQWP